MVCNWSPDPRRDVDDQMPVPSQIVLVESDESDDEVLGNAPPGYELLPQGPALALSSDEENQSEAEVNANTAAVDSPPVDAPSTSHGQMRQPSEVEEVDRLYSTPAQRPELTVDCDEVRAAMAGFTLPSSAYPAWALDVPDAQMAATLAQHIQRIQAERNT